MAITIKDIAAKAGVSRGTVDRVLHNRPGVNSEVAIRIRTLCRTMGYTTNKAGRLLAANKSPIRIGCLLPSIGNHFFDELIRGLETFQEDNKDYGLSLDIRNIKGYGLEEHCRYMDSLVAKGADALLIVSPDDPMVAKKIETFTKQGLPVGCVNTDIPTSLRLFYIGPDYYQSGCTSAGMLALMTKEPQHILIVSGSRSMYGHNQRVKGFLDTLQAKGLDYKIVDMLESLDDENHGYELSRKALETHKEITTVFIVAGGVAGTCRAIEETRKGHRPHILTFDRSKATAQLLERGIIDATVCQQPYRQGYESVSKMFDYLVNKKQGTVPDTIVDTVLVIKENAMNPDQHKTS
ncbi:MAG: LacI family DNA-binding transcriptional regulator [Spirochaetia bacterium]|jgi:LacI family transcriptional regulator|nr:LacI family DNA-binding transcriptional regulator [Spirochaetia bacterium]